MQNTIFFVCVKNLKNSPYSQHLLLAWKFGTQKVCFDSCLSFWQVFHFKLIDMSVMYLNTCPFSFYFLSIISPFGVESVKVLHHLDQFTLPGDFRAVILGQCHLFLFHFIMHSAGPLPNSGWRPCTLSLLRQLISSSCRKVCWNVITWLLTSSCSELSKHEYAFKNYLKEKYIITTFPPAIGKFGCFFFFLWLQNGTSTTYAKLNIKL